MLNDSDSRTSESTVLRDHLAGDRTVLANERTFLSYVRTALTFFVAGLTFIKFFDHTAIVVIGWVFIPISLIVLIAGLFSFRKSRTHISRVVCEGQFDEDTMIDN
ncbi:MAG: DUF202 domain-containing protein [Chloroflexi bacterium]|nr:DUF202 domain-containing protein [Chloroflexota bacterium]